MLFDDRNGERQKKLGMEEDGREKEERKSREGEQDGRGRRKD